MNNNYQLTQDEGSHSSDEIDLTNVLPSFDTTTNKRHRVQEQPTTFESNPYQAAKKSLDASLTPLPQALQTDIKTLMLKFFSTMRTNNQKEASISRLESDEDTIPRSTKFNFKLNAHRRITESEELKKLNEEVEEINLEHSKKLKEKIIKVAKLEQKIILQQAMTELASCITGLSRFYFAFYQRKTKLTASTNHLFYLIKESTTSIQVKLKEYINELPEVRAYIFIALKIPNTETISGDIPTTDKAKLLKAKDDIHFIIKNIIEPAILSFFEAIENRDNLREATKALRTLRLEESTEKTVERMEEEPTVTPELVQDMIDRKVKSALETTQKKIKNKNNSPKKKKQLSTPKGNGGAKGASLKKKSPTKKQQNSPKPILKKKVKFSKNVKPANSPSPSRKNSTKKSNKNRQGKQN